MASVVPGVFSSPLDDPLVSGDKFQAPLDVMNAQQVVEMKLKEELRLIDCELKDWFITRRLKLERNLSLKKLFDRYNFTGLLQNNAHVPPTQQVMWNDLVAGKPELEDELGIDAREMKADKYMKMFKHATDLEHPCRIPGSLYLRCLSDAVELTSEARSSKCIKWFSSFDACRSGLLKQQTAFLSNASIKQNSEDAHAKELFNRRCKILDQLHGR